MCNYLLSDSEFLFTYKCLKEVGFIEISSSVFRDIKTPDPFIEDFSSLGDDGEAAAAAKPNHVYMDTMGFGMGCCCLQVTFQACNINEARCLYDQLAPVSPIAVKFCSIYYAVIMFSFHLQ